VNRVRLNLETAFGRAYQVQVSPDNATWTTLQTTTSDGGIDDLTVSGTGRYVRVAGTHEQPSGATPSGNWTCSPTHGSRQVAPASA
jgi:hypothetical protein